MKVFNIDNKPLSCLSYLNAGRDNTPHRTDLPLLRGQVDYLPDGLDALIMTSDLQRRENAPADRLLGLVLVEHLLQCANQGDIPDPQKIGVILAGDLYGAPGSSRRGGGGDITEVWQAFAEHFRWVTGVLGNHDEISQTLPEHATVLDLSMTKHVGLTIAGLSGIIGDPHRKNRRTEEDFVESVALLAYECPDILVLHQGPDRRPNPDPAVERALAQASNLLVVCGHAPWEDPLMPMPNAVQVMNVEARVVVLSR